MGDTTRALSRDGQPDLSSVSRSRSIMPHSIRLRGPWQCEPLAFAEIAVDGSMIWTDTDLPTPAAIELPGDWSAALGRDFRGIARLTRRFGLPTGLSSSSRVWLTLEEVAGTAAVALNTHALGSTASEDDSLRFRESLANLPQRLASTLKGSPQFCPARWDVTSLLQPRNELTIDLLTLGMGRIGLVTLEIDEQLLE